MSLDIFDFVLYAWFASIFVPVAFLAVVFIKKIRKEGGIFEAIERVDLYYPFPPRHRRLYRSLHEMYESGSEAHIRTEEVRTRVEAVSSELTGIRMGVDSLVSGNDLVAQQDQIERIQAALDTVIKHNNELRAQLAQKSVLTPLRVVND